MLSSKLFKPSLSLLARPQIVQQANVFKRFNNTNTNPSVEQQIAALQKRVEALERSHKSQSESFADFTDWMKNKSVQKKVSDNNFLKFLILCVVLCPGLAYFSYKAAEEFQAVQSKKGSQIKEKP